MEREGGESARLRRVSRRLSIEGLSLAVMLGFWEVEEEQRRLAIDVVDDEDDADADADVDFETPRRTLRASSIRGWTADVRDWFGRFVSVRVCVCLREREREEYGQQFGDTCLCTWSYFGM